MEPADQRRDDKPDSVRLIDRTWPQWSPPTSGGTTAREKRAG